MKTINRQEKISYKVVLTTNNIASFAKEFGAYATGQIGDCKTGTDKMFHTPEEMRNMFANAMEKRHCADDRWRQVEASPDDANAIELFFKEVPTQQMIDHLKTAMSDFSTEMKTKFPLMRKIEMTNMKLVKERTLEETSEVDLMAMTISLVEPE